MSEAERLDIKVLEVKEQLLGRQHPDMNKSRASVTDIKRILKKRNLAICLIRQQGALLSSFTLSCSYDPGCSHFQARQGV
jgi:hypothetical protein